MRRIGNQPLEGAVNQQVRCFQYRLADDQFVIQDEASFDRAASQRLDPHLLRQRNGFLAAIGVFGNPLSQQIDSQREDNGRWPDGAYRSRIYQGVSDTRTDLGEFKLSAGGECGVDDDVCQ